MLEDLFPKYHFRYTASPHAKELRTFADWLHRARYGRRMAQGHVRRLRDALAHWDTHLDAPIGRGVILDLFAALPATERYRATCRAFIRYLGERGRLLAEPDRRPHSAVLIAYEGQLRTVRGLSEPTIAQHISTVESFLRGALPEGLPISALTHELIDQHVVTTGQRISRQTLQHWVARLRSFLRFCHANEMLPQPLDGIDTPRAYRDELPPKALPWRTILALLRSVDRSDAIGWRDYAILHLMSHYGLRPSEVAAMRVDAIDWQARTLRVAQRKTRAELILPMADRTVRILKRYLIEGRPCSEFPELFLRARVPAGPITHYTVCGVYQSRALRSGMDLQGTSAYSLRHSFAMRLLERGVGVKAIGDVLGHRGLESTCVYLRLELNALRDVALPVPRVAERRATRSKQ